MMQHSNSSHATFPVKTLDCQGRLLDLSAPQVMGVLNVTPDSFFDGGRYTCLDAALKHATDMAAAGAAIIDIGGESTRPGAIRPSVQEELDRVIPIIERIAANLPQAISIDTSSPEVMKAAVAAGAGLINDVRALSEEGALQAAADAGVPVCIMHMQNQPNNMQDAPRYEHVVSEVLAYLKARQTACIEAGILPQNIIVDPGFGFGKTLHDNLTLLKQLPNFRALNAPILVGWSNKTSIGEILDKPVGARRDGSIAMATLATFLGADIIRAHDVAGTVDAVKMAAALRSIKDNE